MSIFTRAVFATLLLAMLYFTVRWSIRGEGYWPRGILGVGLAVVLVLGLPVMALLFLRALEHKRPIFWIVPPFKKEALPFPGR